MFDFIFYHLVKVGVLLNSFFISGIF